MIFDAANDTIVLCVILTLAIARSIEAMSKPSEKYLIKLMADANERFAEFVCDSLDVSSVNITYIRTMKQNNMGIMDGARSLAEMKRYNLEESSHINPTCKYYNKFYKKDGTVKKIECFVGGHNDIDVVYVAHYEDNRRYLFPYFSNLEKAVGNYVIVTRYDGKNVMEEYMVNSGQIVYENYDYSNPIEIGYYCINFVPSGSVPILAESEGVYDTNTLTYHSIRNFVWFEK